MAVYEQGYRRYSGPLTPEWSRVLVLPRYSLKEVFSSKLFLAFFVGFFRLRAGVSWLWTLIYAAIGLGFICFLASILGRDFPPGLLQEYFDLPWPFT